jgi:hypothetical protein
LLSIFQNFYGWWIIGSTDKSASSLNDARTFLFN